MAKATSMADLMAKSGSSVKSFKKGEEVEGTITKLTKAEILIDVGAKTEAVVLEKDKDNLKNILSSFKEGDKVKVSVLNPESDQGNPVVSLRRYIEKKYWANVEQIKIDGKPFDVTVTTSTKGGFVVSTDAGISGFLPISQTSLSDTPQSMVGKKVKVILLDVNKANQKIIFSQKAAIGDADYSKATSKFKVGQDIEAKVSNSTPFGIYVSIIGSSDETVPLEGFIHLSEISWDKIETAENYFKNGEIIKAQVVDIDKKAKRINLSVKRLTKDPFDEIASKFGLDTKLKGTIKQISSIGLVVDLGDNVDGFIKKEKIPPTIKYAVGDSMDATVSEIDLKRRRIVLVPVLKDKPIGYR